MKTETEKLIELYHRMPMDQLETALKQVKKQQMAGVVEFIRNYNNKK